MKRIFSVILIVLFFGGISYMAAGFHYFKTYAIIVDNTDAPQGAGTLKAVNVNTLEEYVFTVENGSTTSFTVPEGTYNIFACVAPETAQLYDVIVSGDIAVKLEYTPGTCPF
ncbi:MAG TPA: hypothetical protein VGK25_00015 [Ignavibacteria bacterium]|jgi:hypothetical protein